MPTDFEFAERFARLAGQKVARLRATTRRRKKLDRTDVTDADDSINVDFIREVRAREGRNASVRGEERSDIIEDARRVWVIDPIDGTGEYIDDSVPDALRTTCVGIALFVSGRLVLSVVFNPFRGEMFIADVHGRARLNDRVIRCSTAVLARGVPYDYCYWDGARFDVRGLHRSLGEPRGCYSAIYQACEVAAGRAAFAVFPGDTVHDIAPGALLVSRAGGRVTDLRGRPLVWRDLTHGVIYASTASHASALLLIASL